MEVEEKDGDVPMKDPNANHESHAAQRALLASRRAAKPHATLLSEAKRIWAQARQKDREHKNKGTGAKRDGNKEERRAKIKELMDLVRGHVLDLVLKHDASRIIQTIIKYGTPAERLEVAKELEGNYLQLVQGKYSKFLVSKLIRYCPPSRALILPSLAPEVPRLLHHAYASATLADAYEIHCTGAERGQLLRAFWGREATLFGDGIATGKKAKQTKAVEALIVAREKEKEKGVQLERGLIEEDVPLGKQGELRAVLNASDDVERRKRTLTAVRENLLGIFNNHSPIAVRHAITHRALWDYLDALGSTELFPEDKFSEQERERAWREVYESCQEQLAEMVHTREGSRAVREFIARGTAKDRKQIMKVLKPHILRIAQSDEAQLVLFTALDVIDDTKLTAKQLLGELMPSPPTASLPSTLLTSSAGRRTLLYAIIPRSPRHFTPAIVAALAATDELRAKTSKKDDVVRRDEVRRAASPALLSLVEERGVEMSRDPKGSLVVAEIMLFAEGDKSIAIQTLLAPLSSVYPSPAGSDPHPIDIPHTSRLYKTLLQGGHYSMATRSLSRAPSFDAGAFATAFVSTAGQENVVGMALGGGAFIVAELCERLREEGDQTVKKDVVGWFVTEVREEVKKSTVKGREILLEKLEALRL
ncbi:ARM repeat-containing protein [Ramaria rubella]|nr:ARM repeat-containing protein [Ramaria rubella]